MRVIEHMQVFTGVNSWSHKPIDQSNKVWLHVPDSFEEEVIVLSNKY